MSEPFPELRARPLPRLDEARGRRPTARAIGIDRAGSAHGEPLVPAADFGIKGRNYYAHSCNPPYWAPAPGASEALRVRKGVGERLAAVNARLAAADLELFLFDAWRPREVQAFFHSVWTPAALKRRRPDLDGAALMAEVERYWSPPSADADRPAPHATGAAVDLTLVWRDGQPLFTGSLFDDPSPISHPDHFERDEGADFSFSAEEARANRRILYWVMVEAGFASHPNEWWHFSYGDQLWAVLTGAPLALYGLAGEEPAGERPVGE